MPAGACPVGRVMICPGGARAVTKGALIMLEGAEVTVTGCSMLPFGRAICGIWFMIIGTPVCPGCLMIVGILMALIILP